MSNGEQAPQFWQSPFQDPAGRERWASWQSALQGWQPPQFTTGEGEVGNIYDTMRAYLTNLLQSTGAERYLSPTFINRLRQRAGITRS